MSFQPEAFSAESYFATQLQPPTLEQDILHVREFVERQTAAGRKVVLVTSGGTTVPLELNVVRFLDNFSAGTRGATSAEYFLKAGYAVIFMHRQFSLQPFSRHYSHSTNPFLDFLDVSPTSLDISVMPEKRTQLADVLMTYKAVQREGTLLTLTFVTVNDYLWLLRSVSQELSLLGRKAMYYLAAAVSDFFLPSQRMSEHKIQSGKGSLHIEMDQVPKILKPMVDQWSRDGFLVSFKLETDPALLIPKARGALERYGHQVVIGNDLHRRKFEVVFVSRAATTSTSSSSPSSSSSIPRDEGEDPSITATAKESGAGASAGAGVFVEQWLTIDSAAAADGSKEIEEDIVAELVKKHNDWDRV